MKTKKRFLSFLFCLIFLFCMGCMDGGPGDFVGDDSPLSVEGVKVLSKPANYSFEDAVEGSSVNYYNIFSKEILKWLYYVYEDQNVTGLQAQDLFKDISTNDGLTFNSWGKSDLNKYYLYDSLRYTITNVNAVLGSNGRMEYQILTFDENGWDWTLPKINTFFENLNQEEDGVILLYEEDQAATTKIGILPNQVLIYPESAINPESWNKYYENNTDKLPNFIDAYATGKEKPLENGATDFYYSPYYNAVNGIDEKMNNFFQDAFEYATYLFVLGYDYNKDADDAVLFDFQLVFDDNTNFLKDILVGGWENEKISISLGEDCALARVKEIYKDMGGYIGVTETNKKQIIQFIKDKVIGEKAYTKNTFTITQITTQNGIITNSEELNFNRNYDQIIENIVDYAFTQATIGKDSESGESLTLNQAYLASEITDYKGNYFGASYKDNKDNNMFEFIPAAEYQSIVIYPNEADFDVNALQNKFQSIGDIWLAFEYWDDPRDTITPAADKLKVRDKENGIVINVGFRYFDHEKGQFTADAQVQKKISYGQFPEYYDANGNKNPKFEEEYENHLAIFNDTGTAADKAIGKVEIKTKFNYDIGGGAINPFAQGTTIEGAGDEAKKITIKGATKAREYYALNDSSSYGVFGTLNPNKFKGEDGCDYIEIYFDIVKTKGVVGKNYNFKVALYNFLAAQDVF